VRLGQTLLDHLPGCHEIGAWLEYETDRGQPINGFGLDALEPRDAVQEISLQSKRDQLLDLGCRQAEGLSLDLYKRGGELRERVHGDVPKCQESKEENQACNAQDQ
jgi:hypothetical protein